MSVIKCKMCGGDLILTEGELTAECEYCGSVQTIPVVDNEKKLNLFNRANRLRMNSEFDKAASIYEQIIAEFPEEAEAYWCLCLCNYGVEYVDDPATGLKKPTVHRASFEKLRKDENYELAIEYADISARVIYEDSAREIDRIMGEILSISANESPYDIFICYKETDNKGERTIDSVMAQDIYDSLTSKGYKVFFSRITLEDKLGMQYEPYIFAALNSAKVMLAIGTDYEYYNAVWVKNEWSRFIKLMAKDKSKVLIPCFKGIDAYDMPDEFKPFQSQDMGKVGAMQDLTRGIDKIFGKTEAAQQIVKETVVVNNAVTSNTEPLLKRAFMFLEDGRWQEADEYCEKVLDLDPECARAYLGKLMAELEVSNESELKNAAKPFDENDNCVKASRFDGDLAEKLKEYNANIIYNSALSLMKNAKTEDDYKAASDKFSTIKGFKDADEKAKECLEKIDEIERKAEADKQEAEELYQMLVEALKDKKNGSLSTEEKLSAKIKEKESKIKQKSYRITFLKGNIKKNVKNINVLQSKLEALNAEIYNNNELKAKAQEKRAELESQLSSLGLFAGSKKKEVKAQITEIDEALSKFNSEIKKLEAKKAVLLKEISDISGSIPKIEAEIQKTKDELSIIETKFDREIAELESQLEAEKKSGKAKLSLEEIEKKIISSPELAGIIKNDKSKVKFLLSQKIISIELRNTLNPPFLFGSYPQTNNGEVKPIEWQVLAKEDSRILVISKYALDSVKYNEKFEDTTWENCTLRGWLNDEFLNKAFSSEEQKKIQSTIVSADKNPEYSTNPGNATTDKVFLLSIAEAEKYFTTDESRKCAPTAYAKAQGVWTSDDAKTSSDEATCFWWLRSPGDEQYSAANVCDDGSVDCGSYGVNEGAGGVRPALWISLE